VFGIEAAGQISGQRRLANAALLAGEHDNFHSGIHELRLSCWDESTKTRQGLRRGYREPASSAMSFPLALKRASLKTHLGQK
jgi:hypothetical protein